MNALTALRSALRALAANALRSVLTMLGIIIGVAAVIAMIAVGQGATQRVQEQMKGLGSNIMLVLPGGVSQAGVRLGAQTRQRLTEEDAQAIALEIPEVQVAAPTSRTTGQLVWGNTNWAAPSLALTTTTWKRGTGRCKAGGCLMPPNSQDRPRWRGWGPPWCASCWVTKTR
jgi:putative ABC transport system permease protein